MSMKIVFTCPVCGCHDLMQIQQAVHRMPIEVTCSHEGEWSSEVVGAVQELKGRTLGYRCAHCRYPDVPNHEDAGGFYWQTLNQAADAGALRRLAERTPPPAIFIICYPNGKTRQVTQIPPHSGLLSVEERQEILATHSAPFGSVLLMEGDSIWSHSFNSSFQTV